MWWSHNKTPPWLAAKLGKKSGWEVKRKPKVYKSNQPLEQTIKGRREFIVAWSLLEKKTALKIMFANVCNFYDVSCDAW